MPVTKWVYVDASEVETLLEVKPMLSVRVSRTTIVDSADLWFEEAPEKVLGIKAGNIDEPAVSALITEFEEKYQDDLGVLGFEITHSLQGKVRSLRRCHVCNRFHSFGAMRLDKCRPVCAGCFHSHRACPTCDQFYLKTDGVADSGGNMICPECAKIYDKCPKCGGWTNSKVCSKCGVTATVSVTEDERAQILHDLREGRCGVIHDYSHKPYPIFHKTNSEPKGTLLYFGVEDEVDGLCLDVGLPACPGALLELSDEEKLFYLKYDASIHSGFEIVTHPGTLQFHREVMPWEAIRKVVVKNGGRSHETLTCGLHVHFNSSFLGKAGTEHFELNSLKLLNFVTHYWRQLVRFSRRKPEDMNNWAARYIDDFRITDANRKKVSDIVQGGKRHRAISFSRNQPTIEVRIFKGSLNPKTIIATLELLDYTLHWLVSSDVSALENSTWESFVAGINVAKYPSLKEYLVLHKLA